MSEPLQFTEGAMWEERWEIRLEEDCSELGTDAGPCRHCHSDHQVEDTLVSSGNKYFTRHWICPRVVVGYNEAGYATTGICLDCILDAAKALTA